MWIQLLTGFIGGGQKAVFTPSLPLSKGPLVYRFYVLVFVWGLSANGAWLKASRPGGSDYMRPLVNETLRPLHTRRKSMWFVLLDVWPRACLSKRTVRVKKKVGIWVSMTCRWGQFRFLGWEQFGCSDPLLGADLKWRCHRFPPFQPCHRVRQLPPRHRMFSWETTQTCINTHLNTPPKNPKAYPGVQTGEEHCMPLLGS